MIFVGSLLSFLIPKVGVHHCGEEAQVPAVPPAAGDVVV